MAILDLNLPPDENADSLPDLNDAVPDQDDDAVPNQEEDGIIHVHEDGHGEGADIVGGIQVVDPLNLNFRAATEEEDPVNGLLYLEDDILGDDDHPLPRHENHVNGSHDLDDDILGDDNHPLPRHQNHIYGLNDLEDDVQDYGVYADEINIEFDQEELTDSEDSIEEQSNQRTRNRELKARQRQEIYEALLALSNRGKLQRNNTTLVATRFNVSRRAVQCVWQRAKKCEAEGVPVDVTSTKSKNSGRKRITVDLSRVASIPLHRRTTIRSLAQELGVKKSTLHRWFKDGEIRQHSSSLKPYLKEANKKERLRWALSFLDQRTLPDNPMFIDMRYIIHTDEKWFNATKKSIPFYLLPDEDDPHRTVQNKNSIDKVMVYSAISMPWYDDDGNCVFDGKIGVWPFVRKEPAQRRSDNRPRGTLVTKTMKVGRDTMRAYMITKLLPAIKAKWPREHANKTIWIQQDNALSHVRADDEQFAAAVRQTGLDIRILNQPSNSPDMNCLDLWFFASLQSMTHRRISRNIDELIHNVHLEYHEHRPEILYRVFLTLQSCMTEVMKAKGGNRYKIPHMSKEKLERLSILPKALSCDRELYESCVEFLAT